MQGVTLTVYESKHIGFLPDFTPSHPDFAVILHIGWINRIGYQCNTKKE
jgi:hypothetical protein